MVWRVVVKQHIRELLQQVDGAYFCTVLFMAPQQRLFVLCSGYGRVNQRIIVVPANWAVEVPKQTVVSKGVLGQTSM